MRLFKLTAPMATAAMLLALAPAGASAAHARHHQRVGRHSNPAGCHLGMFAEPHLVTSGESVQLFGAITCPGTTTTTGQEVTLYARSAGTPVFKVLGTTTSGAGGFYSTLATDVTANTVYYASAMGLRSPTRNVKVAPTVTLVGPPEHAQLLTGVRSRTTFSGTVSPADAGARVVLQRENATSKEEWHAIQRGFVGAGGAYSLTHNFVVPGDANIRVVVRPFGKFTVRGVSSALSYQISQKENPLLTLNSSADPIFYGQSTVLSGTAAGGGGKQVTLLARSSGGVLTPVATTTADSGGAYTFTQTPLQNTSYRVQSATGVKSAVLFEGVKYVLTAGASATTVPSGQPLTFSGTVTPDHTGHVVYLERENFIGGGFHVVDVAALGSDSTYTITYSTFGTGKQVFRVKVPGDPSNQGASSTTFPIEVTPAPPSALRPVTPGKLPTEGQL